MGREPKKYERRSTSLNVEYDHESLLHDNYCFVFILRAGISMMPEVVNLFPQAGFGVILV